jgi:hypothetical protein
MIEDLIRIILFVILMNWSFTMHALYQSTTTKRNKILGMTISIISSTLAAIAIL